MTLDHWLREREPAPPARLAQRIDEALGQRRAADATDAAVLCVDAAEQLLYELLARDNAGRECALDLLSVDALVTYAMEAAAVDPDTFASRAHDAMHRLAAAAQ